MTTKHWTLSAALLLAALPAACSGGEPSPRGVGGAPLSAGNSAVSGGAGGLGVSGSAAGGLATSGGAGTTSGGAAAGQVSGGAAGATGGSALAGGGSGGGGPSSGPQIPAAPAACPTIATGNITVLEQQVRIWTGPAGKTGPMVFYWHGTGGVPEEAIDGLGPGLSEVIASGGVVASFSTSTGVGTETGNMVWHLGDFAMTDVIFACALKQGLVEADRVFTAGCSAGGLQASAMVYGRSSYLAAAMPNSGGVFSDHTFQDAHTPALMSTHGGEQDFVKISFADATARFDQEVKSHGGFVVNCDHGGNHCASPGDVKTAQWQFLKAHPFGVSPEPYAASLPATFPDSCQIVH